MKDNKIFIFLSHSHRDYEKVGAVRDLLRVCHAFEIDECSDPPTYQNRLA